MQMLKHGDDPDAQKDLDVIRQGMTIREELIEASEGPKDRNTPPFNTSATTPQGAYPPDNIIFTGEWKYLQDIHELLEGGSRLPQIKKMAMKLTMIARVTDGLKKLYQDTRTLHNISMLNDEVSEVYQTMKRNVLEVLVVGDNMDKLSEKTNCLVSETRAYAKKGRDLNRQALLREWAPAAVIVLGVVFLLFWLQTKIY
ncbi:hypothetical protein ACLB2K_061851 [Fragaria x ananassa]